MYIWRGSACGMIDLKLLVPMTARAPTRPPSAVIITHSVLVGASAARSLSDCSHLLRDLKSKMMLWLHTALLSLEDGSASLLP